MNVENLKTLANYLLSLPEGYKHFDMGDYFRNDDVLIETPTAGDYQSCGTVACAAGHGPACGLEINRYEGWGSYCERVFGLDPWEDRGWDWCFSGGWAYKDNTPQGAGKRILWLLENGEVPDDMDKQMDEDNYPLCYL